MPQRRRRSEMYEVWAVRQYDGCTEKLALLDTWKAYGAALISLLYWMGRGITVDLIKDGRLVTWTPVASR
jgi:hypothetical protein